MISWGFHMKKYLSLVDLYAAFASLIIQIFIVVYIATIVTLAGRLAIFAYFGDWISGSLTLLLLFVTLDIGFIQQ